MNYKRPFVLEILAWFHSLLLFAAPYPFLASLFELKGGIYWCSVFCALLLLLPIILSWFLVQRIRNVLLFLLTGVMVSALTGFLSLCIVGLQHPAGKVYCVIAILLSMAAFTIRTYSKASYGKMKKEFYEVHGDRDTFSVQEWQIDNMLTRPRLFHWAWFIVLYIAGMMFHFTTCLYIIFSMFFADIFLCGAFHYINSLHEYIHQNRRVANLPIQTMQRIHRMIGIIGALFLVLFLLPSVLFGHEFLPDLTVERPDLTFMELMHETQEPSDPEISSEQVAQAIIAQEATPAWVRILIRILCFLVIAALVITAITLLIRYVQNLGKDFSVETEDETVFLATDHTDSVSTTHHRKTSETHLSTDLQIRKRYRKTIQKATKGQPNTWATPSELERDAQLPNDEAVQTLHDTYEKARYSENGCTADDWNTIK